MGINKPMKSFIKLSRYYYVSKRYYTRRNIMSKKIHIRPGKSQSKAGFVVGIIFCLIGLFVVIPTFGIFGIFWTFVRTAS